MKGLNSGAAIGGTKFPVFMVGAGYGYCVGMVPLFTCLFLNLEL